MHTLPARPRHRLPIRTGLAIAAACWVFVSVLDVAGAFSGLDLKTVDWRFQIRGTRQASDVVAVVEIDDDTITAYGGKWPLPRRLPAALLSALGEGGASAVALDLLFLGPDRYDSYSDTLLMIATVNEPAVVHAIAFPDASTARHAAGSPPGDSLLVRHGVVDQDLSIATAALATTPLAPLLGLAHHVGHISVAIDPDGVVRRVPLLLRYDGRLYPALALSALQTALEQGHSPRIEEVRGGLDLSWPSGRRLFVPVDDDGATAIDFAGGRRSFPHSYSMLQVLEWSRGEQIDSLRNAFHHRIVLIGATSALHVATDLGTTPFEAATPLLYIHANLLDALVREQFLFRVPTASRLLVLLLVALLVGGLSTRLGLSRALALTLGLTAAFALTVQWLFVHQIDFRPTSGLLLPPLIYSAVLSYQVGYVERYERARAKDLAIASRIQVGLLPKHPPRHPALDVFGTNVSAQEIGGDYYDWSPTADGQLAIVVGDVEGKGLGASLLMAHLHSSFHGEMRTQASPLWIVEAMHRSMYDAAEARQFATLFLGVISRDGTSLRYCSAGHNPALLVRGSESTWLEATGLPLGMILDGPPYEEREVRLEPGDVLVIYSDGITEFPFRNEMYGEDRLAQTVVRLAASTRSASSIAEGVLGDIREFAHGGPAGDDVTLVVIRWMAGASHIQTGTRKEST